MTIITESQEQHKSHMLVPFSLSTIEEAELKVLLSAFAH